MTPPDYTNSVEINKSAAILFDSITNQIPKWWTASFDGSAANLGDMFTVRFGATHKTFAIEELVPDQKIVWKCTDAHLDHPDVKNKEEWKGTSVVWELFPQDLGTKLLITHRGLTPEMECFDVCQKGWAAFLASLFAFVNSGSGLPYME